MPGTCPARTQRTNANTLPVMAACADHQPATSHKRPSLMPYLDQTYLWFIARPKTFGLPVSVIVSGWLSFFVRLSGTRNGHYGMQGAQRIFM